MALTKITPQMFDTSATTHDLNVDNGTFVVDGSASRVGIGTPTPAQTFHVVGASSTAALLVNDGSNGDIIRVGKAGTDVLKLRAEGTADGAIDASGGSMILKTGGTAALTINGSQNATFAGTIAGTLATAAQTNITSVGTLTNFTSTGIDDNASSTAVTIDSSGNMQVGTTQTFPAFNNVVGAEVGGFGMLSASRTGAESLQLNRRTNDGTIALFKKDGTDIGLIGTSTGDLVIGTAAAALKFRDGDQDIIPWNATTNGTNNGNYDLGDASNQFKNIYLSNAANIGREVSFTNSANSSGFEIGLLGGSSDATAFIYQRANDSLKFGTNNIERLSISSTGNVGIGTPSPSTFTNFTNVTIKGGSAGVNLDFHNASGARRAAFVASDSGLIVETNTTATPIIFKTGASPAERMRIHSTNPYLFLGNNVGHSWGTFNAVAQIGRTGAIANYDGGSNSNQQTLVGSNTYYGASGYTAIEAAAKAVYMNLASGEFFVATAPIVSAGSAQNFTQRLRVLNGGNVIINGGPFSSLPTGSKLNVFGDGEAIRMDGSGATSRTLRFRNVSDANPGIIIADGSLKLETEDANTDIRLSAIRDIEYQTTSTNSTAGDHKFKIYNTEAMAIKGSTNHVKIGPLATASATSAPLHVAYANTDVQAIFGDNNYTIDDPSIRIIGRNSANSHIRYTFAGLDADADHGFIGYNAGSGGFVNALSFDTSGKVGIGTDSPAEKLEVAGTIKITGSNRLLLPNFWIGPVPSTANNNSGAVLLVNLDYANPNNVGFQYSGAIIGNSYTGQAYINVNIVKHYSNDNIDFDVSGDSYLAGTVTRMQLKLCTISYNSNSYLAIVKHGGGTGTIFLNGYFQGWDPSVVTEVAAGTYSITTTHGSLNY